MRTFLRICGILMLLAVLISGSIVFLYPRESLAYLKRTRKAVLRYIFPPKPSNSYQTFKATLPKTYGIHGIDVSAHQGEVNWDYVRSMKIKTDSVTFVFIKATEGTSYFDKYFQHNWEESKRVGILRGAYHYFRPDIKGDVQASQFIQHVHIEKEDLPPVLDIEEIRKTDPITLRKELKIFLDILEKKYAMKPIIYTNKNFYEAYLGKDFKQYPLWVAQYKNLQTPRVKGRSWAFWQHSYQGTVNGINTPVDLNVFESDLEDLKELCKK